MMVQGPAVAHRLSAIGRITRLEQIGRDMHLS